LSIVVTETFKVFLLSMMKWYRKYAQGSQSCDLWRWPHIREMLSIESDIAYTGSGW